MTDKSESLFDLADIKYRWPRKGDRLFVASPDQWNDAEIHSDSLTRAVFMTDGYKAAGDLLIDKAVQDRVARHDLVYPILFCYRQFLELSLKGQISNYGSLVDIPDLDNDPLLKRSPHDLRKLLFRFRQMCRRYGAGDMQAIINVSKCILEFDLMDPTSFTFRYPTERKSGQLYPVRTDRIDLARLKDVMDGVAGFFQGSDGYLDAIVSAAPNY